MDIRMLKILRSHAIFMVRVRPEGSDKELAKGFVELADQILAKKDSEVIKPSDFA